MTTCFPSLVTHDWLAARLGASDLVVLDASYHLPATARDAAGEFAAGHVPGARFLDLASLYDPGAAVPYAFPTPGQIADRLASLGIAGDDAIVIYDDSAIRSAARAWFVLTASGRGKVAILDGGLAKWKAEGHPLERGTSAPARANAAAAAAAGLAPPRKVRSKADMLANLDSGAEQVVDARAAERVFGTGTDPVNGLPMGRIPGSGNLPYTALFNADGTYRSPDELRAAFAAAGVDLARPVTATCGSGVTASVLLFALDLIGRPDAALYDGSWSEWGADPATPKAQGPATA